MSSTPDASPEKVSEMPLKAEAKAPQPKSEEKEKPSSGSIPLGKNVINVKDMEPREYLKHVALWIDPITSTKFLSAITILWYYTGYRGYTVFSFIFTILFLRTIALFATNYLGESLKSKDSKALVMIGTNLEKVASAADKFFDLPSEKNLEFWLDGTSKYLSTKLGGFVTALRKAETDVKTLKVVSGHLIAFWILFSLFSLRTIVFGLAYGAMIIPGVYVRQQKAIDPILQKMKTLSAPYVDKAKSQADKFGSLASAKVDVMKEKFGAKMHEFKEKAEAQVSKVSQKVSDKMHKMQAKGEAAAKKEN